MTVNIISMVHQRGPKYELVIEDLMKNTPPEFEDRDALGEALVSMKTTNTLINSCVMGVQKDVKVKVHKNNELQKITSLSYLHGTGPK